MKTTHKIIFENAKNMKIVENSSIEMILTSSVYPLIQMWDEEFSRHNPDIKSVLEIGDGITAFELMNKELDNIWDEMYRVLVPGGMACINIGDATRSFNKNFQLFSNHARFLQYFMKLGFQILPEIIWRKQSNAPNKFMGSGVLPPGAYVTLEHEFILILRKGGKREFKTDQEKLNRQQSAFFWEERNIWFSDLWTFKGVSQQLRDETTRKRSAAYPFELAYRLINMFSVKGDTILDPFLGTGTSTIAALASERNSIGYEIDATLKDTIFDKIAQSMDFANKYIDDRLNKHVLFVNERIKAEKELKYINEYYQFPVITRQEIKLIINKIKNIQSMHKTEFIVGYQNEVRRKFSFETQKHLSKKDLLDYLEK